ncbi:MAG: class I SAM-dependent methyltransferase [Planctomycetota bacterium]|jgi:predicted O-methyltransferase YrrM
MSSTSDKLFEFAGKYGRALVHSAAAFTYGVFTYKGRSIISEVDKIARSKPEKVEQTVPQIPVSDLLDGKAAMRICEPEAVLGNVTLLETIIINQLIAARQPQCLFEIGTFDGRTTLNMAANAPGDAQVFTLDLPKQQLDSTALVVEEGDRAHIDKDASGLRFQGREEAGKITQLYGDSATFDFAPYHGKVDLIFVDGAHSYEYVINDSKIALELLRDGKGVILWHDYGSYPGVTKALNELHAKGGVYSGLRHIADTAVVCLLG